MKHDIGDKVLAPVIIKSGLSFVLCKITAWQDFATEDGYERTYECISVDAKFRVVVSENLLREYRWK